MNGDIEFFQQSEVGDGRVGRLGGKVSRKLNLNSYVWDASFLKRSLVLIFVRRPLVLKWG